MTVIMKQMRSQSSEAGKMSNRHGCGRANLAREESQGIARCGSVGAFMERGQKHA